MRYGSAKFKAHEDVRQWAIIAGILLSALSAWPMMGEWMASPGGVLDTLFLFTWWPVTGFVVGWWVTRIIGELGVWFVWGVVAKSQLPFGIVRRARGWDAGYAMGLGGPLGSPRPA